MQWNRGKKVKAITFVTGSSSFSLLPAAPGSVIPTSVPKAPELRPRLPLGDSDPAFHLQPRIPYQAARIPYQAASDTGAPHHVITLQTAWCQRERCARVWFRGNENVALLRKQGMKAKKTWVLEAKSISQKNLRGCSITFCSLLHFILNNITAINKGSKKISLV